MIGIILLISIPLILFFYITRRIPLKVTPVEEIELAPSLEIGDKTEYDIIIVGAGISGVSAAHTYLKNNPKKVRLANPKKKAL